MKRTTVVCTVRTHRLAPDQDCPCLASVNPPPHIAHLQSETGQGRIRATIALSKYLTRFTHRLAKQLRQQDPNRSVNVMPSTQPKPTTTLARTKRVLNTNANDWAKALPRPPQPTPPPHPIPCFTTILATLRTAATATTSLTTITMTVTTATAAAGAGARAGMAMAVTTGVMTVVMAVVMAVATPELE